MKKSYKREKINKVIFLGILLALIFLVFSLIYFKLEHNREEQNFNISVEFHAKRIVEVCELTKQKTTCYAEQFKLLNLKNPLALTLQVLNRVQDQDNHAKFCHLLSHQIAITEVSKDPKNWLNLFSKLDPVQCSRGFFHGILEGHNRNDPSFLLTEQTMTEICQQIITKFPETQSETLHQNCVHTLGHLLLVQHGANIDTAIAVCSKTESKFQYQCYSGVFMENLQKQNLLAHGLTTNTGWDRQKLKKQQDICFKYSGMAGVVCWKNLAWLYIRFNGRDLKRLFNDCSQAPTKQGRDECYLWGASIVTVLRLTNYLPQKNINDMCEVYKDIDADFKKCSKEIILYALSSDIQFVTDLKSYCGSIKRELQTECKKLIEQTLSDLTEGSANGEIKILFEDNQIEND